MGRSRTVIFVTVGGHTPFDRLIQCVDEWAVEHPETEFYAQIGAGEYEPLHMPWTRFLSPPDFRRSMQSSTAIVAHAGMGTILTALDLQKAILVLPRTARLRETRNDHQLATAKKLAERNLIHVAADTDELSRRLEGVEALRAQGASIPALSPELRNTIRGFIGNA